MGSSNSWMLMDAVLKPIHNTFSLMNKRKTRNATDDCPQQPWLIGLEEACILKTDFSLLRPSLSPDDSLVLRSGLEWN